LTLLVSISSERQTVLVADRRITADGQIVDDEFNKLLVLFCDDARVAIAFTGLATAGNFHMQDWLRNALVEIGNLHHSIDRILDELSQRVSVILLQPPISRLPSQLRQLAILVTGYRYEDSGPTNYLRLISNSDDPNLAFAVGPNRLHARSVTVAGCLSALPAPDVALLEKISCSSAKAESLEQAAIRIVQKLSKKNGLIGRQCNSAIIRVTVDTPIVSTYHAAEVTNRAYGADGVWALSTGRLMLTGIELVGGTALAGPPIRKNEPCWCNSGKKFKHCHLRILGSVYVHAKPFRRPLAWAGRLKLSEPLASGSFFCVSSGFR
jgi:hypothetical protein